VTLGTAISNGEKEFDTIVAVYGAGNDQKIIPPCGNCRQIMYEIDKEIKVIVNNTTILKISELLPFACI